MAAGIDQVATQLKALYLGYSMLITSTRENFTGKFTSDEIFNLRLGAEEAKSGHDVRFKI
jgi:hypothetical protein